MPALTPIHARCLADLCTRRQLLSGDGRSWAADAAPGSGNPVFFDATMTALIDAGLAEIVARTPTFRLAEPTAAGCAAEAERQRRLLAA